jgi:hypothetical protein
MAKGKKIEASHSYDKEADVLYIAFGGDDEPTYGENIDDVTVLEIGWFTQLPKGLTVIGLKSHRITSIQGMVVQVRQKAHSLMEQRRAQIEAQEPAVADVLNDLPRIFRKERQRV